MRDQVGAKWGRFWPRVGEAVAVVPPAELGAIGVVGEAHDLCVGTQVLVEIGVQLLLGVAQERGIAGIHRQVVEVVQRREDGELGEARDAGHHQEADVGGTLLDLDVEVREFASDGRGERDVGQCVADGRIVFVDEEHHGLAGLLHEGTDGSAEVRARGEVRIPGGLRVGKGLLQTRPEVSHEGLQRRRLDAGEGEVEDGVVDPVVVQLVDGEAGKEVAAALEDTLQGRDHEGLAKAARTGDEEELPADVTGRDESVEGLGLVNVDVAHPPQLGEVRCVLCDVGHEAPPSPSV